MLFYLAASKPRQRLLREKRVVSAVPRNSRGGEPRCRTLVGALCLEATTCTLTPHTNWPESSRRRTSARFEIDFRRPSGAHCCRMTAWPRGNKDCCAVTLPDSLSAGVPGQPADH